MEIGALRMVAGRRELDDFRGLASAGSAGVKASFLSYLVISAVSVGACFGAVTMVKDAFDRALGPGAVDRALHLLDPDDFVLHRLTNTNWPTISTEMTFVSSRIQVIGHRAFGQRKIPPPHSESSVASTNFASESKICFASSADRRHQETHGFVEASRSGGGQAIVAMKPTARSM